MTGIDSVVIVEQWVSDDLASDVLTGEDAEEVLDDIDELEENLVTWGRSLTDAVDILTTQTEKNIYKRRQGKFRSFFVRDRSTLYCIGVGPRATVYDRQLDRIEARAERLDEGGGA